MEPLTDAEIEEIRARCEAATPVVAHGLVAVDAFPLAELQAHARTDVPRLLATFDAERAARQAAEDDARQLRRSMERVQYCVLDHTRRRSTISHETRLTLADPPAGVTRWQAVVEAARQLLAETRPHPAGMLQRPTRAAVDALAEALRAWEAGA